MDKQKKSGPSRRQVLVGAAASAGLPAVHGIGRLVMRPKVILELTRNAATNSMRAVERVIWVAK